MQTFINNEEPSFPRVPPVPGLGDLVRIHGLVNAPKYNGKLGQVIAVHHNTGRYGVSIYDWTTIEKSIRPSNLKVQPLITGNLFKRALAWYTFWFAEMVNVLV